MCIFVYSLTLVPLTSYHFAEMGPLSEKSDEKRARLSIDAYQVDTGAWLVSGVHSPLDQTESLRIRYVPHAGH